jgi:Mannosylglycerate hydrolase MGH1-like glycoside hydrolase domain/N-terminal domain of (some) glycogen debranching enzymes
MSRSLATDSLSLTGGGAALVTDAAGSISPEAVAGVFVDDVRVVATWSIDPGAASQLVGHVRLGPSNDRLISTLSAAGSIDPVAKFERTRTIGDGSFHERLRITAYVAPLTCTLRIVAGRDDCPVFDVGDSTDESIAVASIAPGAASGRFTLPGPFVGPEVALLAPGWRLDGGALLADVHVEPGETWQSLVSLVVEGDGMPPHDPGGDESNAAALETAPADLAAVVATGRADLRALTIRVDDLRVFGAGSPFFLALFGRDSLITGIQALLDTPRRLLDILKVLAARQATAHDAATRAEPGRILHELRLGRAGVFGVAPRTPYYGAVDTAALFVVALGEAWRWGAPADVIAKLHPAALAALDWCRRFGDADGDGFVESVPHPSGLTNLGWKDSGDAIVDTDGVVRVEAVALPEVQAYWYRAARTVAELEQHLGLGDGAESLAEADRLAAAFASAFLFESEGGPFVGLALDTEKRLLAVRASNAGHVLWSGALAPDIAAAVARQLADPDLFSGWGVRTLSSTAAGYNPFGYHRGSVWPHDTGIALHGASRYGVGEVVRRLADGLIALGVEQGGQLPELISGIDRSDLPLPVPYAAACRPQAWAAGASLTVVRSLLGLEPDVPNGVVRVNPMLHPGHTITMHGVRCGEHEISLTATGSELVEIDSSGLDVVTGPAAVLATTDWCPPAAD